MATRLQQSPIVEPGILSSIFIWQEDVPILENTLSHTILCANISHSVLLNDSTPVFRPKDKEANFFLIIMMEERAIHV